MPIEVNGKSLETDEEGYLSDLNQWEPGVADVMSKEDDLELTDDHWEIINFLREYYVEYGVAPMIRKLCKATGFKLKKIYELFPSGPAKGACKVAGLPKPTGCV